MSFNPEAPANPQDLLATFDVSNRLNGLIYKSPENGSYSRVNGEWVQLADNANPLGQGALVVFVNPDFILEYDSRMMYREYLPSERVQAEFGVKPNFDFDPFAE